MPKARPQKEYSPPEPDVSGARFKSEYLQRRHFQGDLTLKDIHVGRFEGNRCVYPTAHDKQNSLLGIIVDAAVQVALEECLLKDDGITAAEIARFGVIKNAHGKEMSEPEIRSKMLELYPGQRSTAKIHFDEDKAKEFVRKLKSNKQLKMHDDFAGPEQLSSYQKRLELYRQQKRQYIELSADEGPNYRAPQKPVHPYIKALHGHKAITELVDVVENGIKNFKTATEKQAKAGRESWDIHDINRAIFIPKTIRAYLRFSEIVKDDVRKRTGYNDWSERPMQMQPTGFCGAKILIPISEGFRPDARNPATATLAEVMILEPAQYAAHKKSHAVYETIRMAKESKTVRDASGQSGGEKIEFHVGKMTADDELRLEAEYMKHVEYFRRHNTALHKERSRESTPPGLRGNNSYYRLIDKVKENNLQFHGEDQVERRLGELLELNQSVHMVAASTATPEWRKLYIYKALEYNHQHQRAGKAPPIPTDMIMDIDPEIYSELSGLFIAKSRVAKMTALKVNHR